MSVQEELRTSADWNGRNLLFRVLDEDGWHRDERFHQEWFVDKITWDEFKCKAMRSTCQWLSRWD
jgi:hypothetical protein